LAVKAVSSLLNTTSTTNNSTRTFDTNTTTSILSVLSRSVNSTQQQSDTQGDAEYSAESVVSVLDTLLTSQLSSSVVDEQTAQINAQIFTLVDDAVTTAANSKPNELVVVQTENMQATAISGDSTVISDSLAAQYGDALTLPDDLISGFALPDGQTLSATVVDWDEGAFPLAAGTSDNGTVGSVTSVTLRSSDGTTLQLSADNSISLTFAAPINETTGEEFTQAQLDALVTNGGINCVFWDTSVSTWDTDGCVADSASAAEQTVTCVCTHLTDFALRLSDGASSDPIQPSSSSSTSGSSSGGGGNGKTTTIVFAVVVPVVVCCCVVMIVVLILALIGGAVAWWKRDEIVVLASSGSSGDGL